MEARFVKKVGERVRLQREDGTSIDVELASLSDEDRRMVESREVESFENAVFLRDGRYIWKIDKIETGQTEDLAEAVQKVMGEGSREVHLLAGGTLARTIHLKPGLKLYGHGNTFEKTHHGTGFYREGSGGIGIYDLNLTGGTGWGFHLSRASDLVFERVHITGGGIGMRIESHPSRPWEKGRWVKNLVVKDCSFEGCGSHGLETYGMENLESIQDSRFRSVGWVNDG